MKLNELIGNDTLEFFGFKRMDESDLMWSHPFLEVKNLYLNYFDDTYHFMVNGNTYQGIGSMKYIKDLEVGFKFVTGINIFNVL